MMSEEEVWEYLKHDFSKEEFDAMVANSKTILNKVEFYDLFNPQIIPTIKLPQVNLDAILQKSQYIYLDKMLEDDNIQNNVWIKTCLNKFIETNLIKNKIFKNKGDYYKIIQSKFNNYFGMKNRNLASLEQLKKGCVEMGSFLKTIDFKEIKQWI